MLEVSMGKCIGIIIIMLVSLTITICGCVSTKGTAYNPSYKYAPAALQQDYTLLRNIMQQEHPSIYWYTPKASMDSAWDAGYKQLKDSLTEQQFKMVISQPIAHIQCGHTSVRSTKGYDAWLNKANIPYCPLGMRIVSDTMLVSYNLYRKDTIVPRGSRILSINGESTALVLHKLYSVISTDGVSNTFKNMKLSNNFPYYYYQVYDSVKHYTYTYTDSINKVYTAQCSSYIRKPLDTALVRKMIATLPNPITPPKQSKRTLRKLHQATQRRLSIDTGNTIATITLNSFSGRGFKRFTKATFKTIKKKKIQHVILDVRNNGGGEVSNFVNLTKYLHTSKFKVADTVVAIKKSSSYNRYIKYRFWYGISMLYVTHKQRDGLQHFGYFERHKYTLKKRLHYNGNTYIITGGFSFSATTLLVNSLRQVPTVTTVGETTGGGAYGNSAVYIPNITLPNSKLRVRLPVFRLVQANALPKNGMGLVPQVYVPPTPTTVRNGTDNKMEAVQQLIKAKQGIK